MNAASSVSFAGSGGCFDWETELGDVWDCAECLTGCASCSLYQDPSESAGDCLRRRLQACNHGHWILVQDVMDLVCSRRLPGAVEYSR